MSRFDTETERKDLRSVPHNVPVQLTSLVGREREVAAACELLSRDEIRLLTLTGAPGIGKTRLGVEVAARLRGQFADGITFVNLAPVSDHDLVVQAIASALGIRPVGELSLEDILARFLSGKQILLLLDNFEQVLAAGPAIAHLLKAAPRLKVLVTSRELLRVSGEYDFPVPPLSLPPVLAAQGESGRHTPLPPERLADYEAVQLFVQRAVAYKPDLLLSEENAYIIAAICRKLDGLPLAIELAAARIRHLSPQAIFDRLRDRLALLTSGARDLPLRQRTLRATIEWSYGLLGEDEKRLFRRLAVFLGGRTLEAIEAVCNSDQDLGIEPLNGVASLVDKSLLHQATDNSLASGRRRELNSEPRYLMLETLQEYAKERLDESGEAEAIHRNHAIYFTALAERAEMELHGPRQVEWLDRLESEQDNLLAALYWARSNSLDVGLRLVAALNIYWNRRGYLIEGREWASEIVSRARGISARSTLENGVPQLSDIDQAMHASMVRALYTLGLIAFRQGNYVSAQSFLAESIETYRRLEASGDELDTRDLVEPLNVLGIVKSRLENMQVRRTLHEEALDLARQAGDNWSVARSLFQLGHVARLTSDYEAALSLFEESLLLFKESGDKFNISLALVSMGQVAERREDYPSAYSFFEEALGLFKELGDKWGISGTLFCLGCAYMGLKDYSRARAILEDNLIYTEELGTTGDAAETLEKLGKAAFFQGDYENAHLLYKRSLSASQSLGDKMGIARCLIDLAGVIAVGPPTESAVSYEAAPDDTTYSLPLISAARLLGISQILLESVGFHLDSQDRDLFDGYITVARNRLGEQAFSDAWAEGQAMTLDEAISCAREVPPPGPSAATDDLTPPRQATRPDFGGLTKREREIAALVSLGKSNRAIAADLVVSERTVEGHVNNILSKLGFHSRAQIAAWAVDTGLVKLSG